MLIPFNFSIDFLMAHKQNNYQHIAFLLSHFDDTNWKPTAQRPSTFLVLHPLEPALRCGELAVPPQLAQLLERERTVSTGRHHHFTCRITGVFYNRSKMNTTAAMCLKCFLYKLRDTALEICSFLHLRNHFQRKQYMCMLKVGDAIFYNIQIF